MKQLIILIASIMLGLTIVTNIMGDNGIFDSMKSLWTHELSMRNMQIVGP